MSALTRRHSDDPHRETWHVYFGDVCIGSLTQRSGVPVHVDQWRWDCGFYPMSDRGIREDGTASDLFKARAAFAAAWWRIEPLVTDSDLLEHRRQRAWTAWKYRMLECGCRMPTQMSSGWSRCFCGVEIGIADVENHVAAAHMEHVGC